MSSNNKKLRKEIDIIKNENVGLKEDKHRLMMENGAEKVKNRGE